MAGESRHQSRHTTGWTSNARCEPDMAASLGAAMSNGGGAIVPSEANRVCAGHGGGLDPGCGAGGQ